mgnify:FL=1
MKIFKILSFLAPLETIHYYLFNNFIQLTIGNAGEVLSLFNNKWINILILTLLVLLNITLFWHYLSYSKKRKKEQALKVSTNSNTTPATEPVIEDPIKSITINALQDSLQQSPVSIVITDIDGKIQYVNQKFKEITGYSEEEAIGQNPAVLKTGHTTEEEYLNLWAQIKAGKTWEGEFLNKRKDGSHYWESASISPVTDVKGEITHFIGVKVDITEHKLMAEKLKSSEATFKALFNSASEAVYILSKEGLFIDINEAAIKMYGFSKERFQNNSPFFLSAGGRNDLPKVMNLLTKAYNGEKHSFEFWGQKANGEIFPTLVSIGPGEYFGKKIIIAIGIDLSRHRSYQKEQADITKIINSNSLSNSVYSWFYSLSDGVIRIKNLNQEGEKEYQDGLYSIEEFVKNIEPTDIIIVNQYFKTLATDHPTYSESEFRLIKTDGIHWIAISGEMVSSETDHEINFKGIIKDITNDKRKELRLVSSESYYHTISESITEIAFVIDKEGSIRYINAAVTKQLFYDTLDVSDSNIASIIHSDDKLILSSLIKMIVLGQKVPNKHLIRFRKADGDYIAFNVSINKSIDKVNPDDEYLIIGYSLTDAEKRLENQQRSVNLLTNQLKHGQSISIADLFNINELQKIQDAFAFATGVASIITFPNGVPFTKPSNFCRLCSDIIRGTAKGRQNCMRSDSLLLNTIDSTPKIQPCVSAGLLDFGVPIIVEQQIVGHWIIGQVRNSLVDDSKVLQYATELDVNPVVFRAALEEVPFMSEKQLEKVAKALQLMAGELSLQAFQNLQQARLIKEKEQTVQLLQKSEERNKALLATIPDMIFIFNKEGRYTDFSCSSNKYDRISKARLVGRTLWDVLPKDIADSTFALFPQLLNSNSVGSLQYELPEDGINHFYSARLTAKGNDEILAIVREVINHEIL